MWGQAQVCRFEIYAHYIGGDFMDEKDINEKKSAENKNGGEEKKKNK